MISQCFSVSSNSSSAAMVAATVSVQSWAFSRKPSLFRSGIALLTMVYQLITRCACKERATIPLKSTALALPVR